MIFLSFASAILADPSGGDCPEGKSSSPQTDVSPSPSLPSTSPQEGAASQEPSTTKDQIGLTFDPSTMIPDKPIVEEKNPARKRILDNIFEAKTKEAEAQMRLDEIARLEKDLERQRQGVRERDQKLFKEWDDIIEKKKNASIFRSLEALDKETDRIIRELGNNRESLESMRKQVNDLHEERVKTYRKETDAVIQRFSLEESLGRMDAVQKEASRRDANNAEVPAPKQSGR